MFFLSIQNEGNLCITDIVLKVKTGFQKFTNLEEIKSNNFGKSFLWKTKRVKVCH